jgi:hypothetical protein
MQQYRTTPSPPPTCERESITKRYFSLMFIYVTELSPSTSTPLPLLQPATQTHCVQDELPNSEAFSGCNGAQKWPEHETKIKLENAELAR